MIPIPNIVVPEAETVCRVSGTRLLSAATLSWAGEMTMVTDLQDGKFCTTVSMH